jgi:hypothetical protein
MQIERECNYPEPIAAPAILGWSAPTQEKSVDTITVQ